jgi:hypothetical protein
MERTNHDHHPHLPPTLEGKYHPYLIEPNLKEYGKMKTINLISCLHQAKRNVSEARTRKERIEWLMIQAILEGIIAAQTTKQEEDHANLVSIRS